MESVQMSVGQDSANKQDSKFIIYADVAQVKVFAQNELSERCKAPKRNGAGLAAAIRNNTIRNGKRLRHHHCNPGVNGTAGTTGSPTSSVKSTSSPMVLNLEMFDQQQQQEQQYRIHEYRASDRNPYLVKEPPTIGVVLSGGGWRSMEASTNFMDTLRLSGVLSHVSVVAGLSGGSWTCVLGGMSGEKNYLYKGGEQAWGTKPPIISEQEGHDGHNDNGGFITSDLNDLVHGDEATQRMLAELKTMLSADRAELAAKAPYGTGKPSHWDILKDALSSIGRVAAKVAYDEHLPHLMAILGTNPKKSYLYNYSRILDTQFYGPPPSSTNSNNNNNAHHSKRVEIDDVELHQDKKAKIPLMVVAATSFARYSEDVHIHDWFEFDATSRTIQLPVRDEVTKEYHVSKEVIHGGGLRECTHDARRKTLPDLRIRFSHNGDSEPEDTIITAPIVMAIGGCALDDFPRKYFKCMRIDKDSFSGHIYDFTRQNKQLEHKKRSGARPLLPAKPFARLYDAGISCNVPIHLVNGRCNIAFVLDNSHNEKASEELAVAVCKGFYHIHVPGEIIKQHEEPRVGTSTLDEDNLTKEEKLEGLLETHKVHSPVEAAFLQNHVHKWMTKDGKNESTDVVRVFLPKKGYSKAVWGEKDGGSRKDDEPILIYLRGLRTESTFRMDRTPEEIDENHRYMTELTSVAVKALEFIIKQENIIPAAGYWTQADFVLPDGPQYKAVVALPLAPPRTIGNRVFSLLSTYAPFRLMYGLVHSQMEKLIVRSRKLGATGTDTNSSPNNNNPPSQEHSSSLSGTTTTSPDGGVASPPSSPAINHFWYSTVRRTEEENEEKKNHSEESTGKGPTGAATSSLVYNMKSPQRFNNRSSRTSGTPTTRNYRRVGEVAATTNTQHQYQYVDSGYFQCMRDYWSDPSYMACVNALCWILETLKAMKKIESLLVEGAFDVVLATKIVSFPEHIIRGGDDELMQFKCLAASLSVDGDLLDEFGHLTSVLRAVIRTHRPAHVHPDAPYIHTKVDEVVDWADRYEHELMEARRYEEGGGDDEAEIESRRMRQQELHNHLTYIIDKELQHRRQQQYHQDGDAASATSSTTTPLTTYNELRRTFMGGQQHVSLSPPFTQSPHHQQQQCCVPRTSSTLLRAPFSSSSQPLGGDNECSGMEEEDIGSPLDSESYDMKSSSSTSTTNIIAPSPPNYYATSTSYNGDFGIHRGSEVSASYRGQEVVSASLSTATSSCSDDDDAMMMSVGSAGTQTPHDGAAATVAATSSSKAKPQPKKASQKNKNNSTNKKKSKK